MTNKPISIVSLILLCAVAFQGAALAAEKSVSGMSGIKPAKRLDKATPISVADCVKMKGTIKIDTSCEANKMKCVPVGNTDADASPCITSLN